MTATTPRLAAGRWTAVAVRTTAGFAVRNLGVKTVRGTIPVRAAWVDVDPTGAPTLIHAVLDLTGIDTGHRKRDADLQKPHLLDTAHHPTLTFSGVPAAAADGWEVIGELAGRAAATVTLRVQPVERAEGTEVSVRATTTLDRRALGVRAPRLLIGRWLAVEIAAVFAPPSGPATQA